MSDGTQQNASDPTRDELNERATELGIENPKRFSTKEDVEAAIADAESVPRFTRDEVLDNARTLTGYSFTHMSGALHGVEQEAFTKEQATKLGKDFAEHEQEVED